MRVMVCSGRNYDVDDGIRKRLLTLFNKQPSAVIVIGDELGVAACEGYVADTLGLKVAVHPAEWARHGEAAGQIRNQICLIAEQI
jgi:hypothetical protein